MGKGPINFNKLKINLLLNFMVTYVIDPRQRVDV